MPLDKTASPSHDKTASPNKKTPLPYDLVRDNDRGKYTSVHLPYTNANYFQITSGPGRMRTRKNGTK